MVGQRCIATCKGQMWNTRREDRGYTYMSAQCISLIQDDEKHSNQRKAKEINMAAKSERQESKTDQSIDDELVLLTSICHDFPVTVVLPPRKLNICHLPPRCTLGGGPVLGEAVDFPWLVGAALTSRHCLQIVRYPFCLASDCIIWILSEPKSVQVPCRHSAMYQERECKRVDGPRHRLIGGLLDVRLVDFVEIGTIS